jgi:3-phosphoshikimate 1-carboxyvinyltransferase
MLAALADGTSEILHFSNCDDCQRTLECLSQLGVKWARTQDGVIVHGAGLRGLRKSWRKLDAGNSGTTMRLLAGILAGQPFTSTLTGDDSLRRRPMRRIMEPLTAMGAEITAREGNFAPLRIRGGALRGIQYTLPVASAQVKSAILLAALFASSPTVVVEPLRTRDHTELALTKFGVELGRTGNSVCLQPPERLLSQQLDVPGDISAAVYFLAAAMILPESSLMLRGVGLNPTRAAVLDFLAEMGASIRPVNLTSQAGEVVGDLHVDWAPLKGGVIRGPRAAQMIDELPMLAALAPFTETGIEIRDAEELRVKESDRIAAVVENLRRMGAEVEELADGMRVGGRGAKPLRGAEIEPRGDHRIAMAFAIAALGAEGESSIREPECVAVSFPEFFQVLEAVAKR